MPFDSEPRFRISAKQTAKNFWQLDGTVEHKNDKMTISTDPNDTAVTVESTLGLQLLSMIKEAEKEFREDGRKIVGDE